MVRPSVNPENFFKNTVGTPRNPLTRFGRFWRISPNVESVTYGLSISGAGSIPTRASIISGLPKNPSLGRLVVAYQIANRRLKKRTTRGLQLGVSHYNVSATITI